MFNAVLAIWKYADRRSVNIPQLQSAVTIDTIINLPHEEDKHALADCCY